MAVGGIGMISTANYVARRYGVRSAMPGFIGRRLCPELVFVRPGAQHLAQKCNTLNDMIWVPPTGVRRVTLEVAKSSASLSDLSWQHVTTYCIHMESWQYGRPARKYFVGAVFGASPCRSTGADFQQYVEVSQQTRAIFADFDPDMHAGSLDEAFLDVTAYCAEHGVTGAWPNIENLPPRPGHVRP